MSYIDYNMADLTGREVFSCTKTEGREIYRFLGRNPDIYGAVIIATCNRTELYLSLRDGAETEPFRELCRAIGVSYDTYAYMHRTLRQTEAIRHLCKVASGAESQIWGEDQIISQVRDAIRTARELKASDSILNVVFRTGVSAGKKVKTLVDFKTDDDSTALRAVSVLKNYPDVKDVLVIGNGMIGRLVAEILVREGYGATMTLRQYKHGENVIPRGCGKVNYGDRYEKLSECDACISATSSPHFTVTAEGLKGLSRVPKVFVDLAVPRDIDPGVSEIDGVSCFNVDDISREIRSTKKAEQLKQIDSIIEKYIDDFYKWLNFRDNMKKENAG